MSEKDIENITREIEFLKQQVRVLRNTVYTLVEHNKRLSDCLKTSAFHVYKNI